MDPVSISDWWNEVFIPFLLSNDAGVPRFITTFDQDLREPRTLHLTRLGWNPGVQKTSLDNWDFEMFIS